MNTHFPALARTAATGALIAALSSALLVCAANASHAQTTFFSTGFEASEGYSTTATGPTTVYSGGVPITTFTPVPGALFGQPATGQNSYRFNSFNNYGPATSNPAQAAQQAINSTTVVNTSASAGAQSVQMSGPVLGNQAVQYTIGTNFRAGTNSSLRTSADLRVTNPSASYGQWGINFLRLRDDGQFLDSVGAIGFVAGSVIASPDGTNLYAAFNPATGMVYRANYNEYNNYALQLNFTQRTISGYFNDTKVAFVPVDAMGNVLGIPVSDMSFRSVADNFVSEATFGQALNNAGESANFDNIRLVGTNVTANAAPEPASLALLGLGLCGVVGAAKRRKAKQVA